jgi:hypothetical protein
VRKRENEARLLREMAYLYCRSKHSARGGLGKAAALCPDCAGLLDYALERTARCPFMETKTFCSACSVHCYSRERQEQIRELMRFSGSRLLLRHPVVCLRHIFTGLRAKKQLKRKDLGK